MHHFTVSLTGPGTAGQTRKTRTGITYSLDTFLLVTETGDELVKQLFNTPHMNLTAGAGAEASTAESARFDNKSENQSWIFLDLDKETAQNLSAALALTPAEGVTLSLSLFHNRIRDRITYFRDGTLTGQYRNLGRVIYEGGELSCDLTLPYALTLKAAWSYLEAKDDATGLFLSGSSRHRIRGGLVWTGIPGLSMRFSGKYTGPAFSRSDNFIEVGGFTVWDLRLEYRFSGPKTPLLLYADLKNMFDTRYNYAEGYRGNPRSLLCGFQWQF